MPFKSEAQRRKFQDLLKQGKISQSVYDAFESETGGKDLPERATKKAQGKKPQARTKIQKVRVI